MTSLPELDREIENMKRVLAVTVERCAYNLEHPKVLAISRKLDRLIIRQMKLPKCR